ncbi:MAG TPA: cysteine desulfurase CsdA, partial [Rudaea sp.]|nr:cysteine desulfurase CsdA [Rudaea sp.]
MNAKPSATVAFDPLRYRSDFPLLARRIHGKPLIYFDNANTSQK